MFFPPYSETLSSAREEAEPPPPGSLRRWSVAASAGVWLFQALHLAPLLLWVAERAYGHTASPAVLHEVTGQRLLVTQK